MHIKHISIGRLTIPLKSAFTTAVRTTASLTDLVVTITTVDGAVGFGSAALVPAVTGYDEAGVLAALERLTLFLFENNPDGPLTLAQKLSEKCLEAPPALAAMDTALYDLAAKNAGLPLAAFLGGTLAPIPILATVSLAAPEVMAREAKHLLGRGFQTLKLKVGKGVTDDQERIEAVATRVPPSISLVLDANQGWSQEEAHAMLTWLSRWPNIRLLEQPLAAADHQGLADLTARCGIPIYADESVQTPADASMLKGCVNGFNLKLQKSGGLHPTLRLIQMAHSMGLGLMAGCMLESPVGIAAMASLVSAAGGFSAVDLDPLELITENPVEGGAQLSGCTLTPPASPGLGIHSIHGVQALREFTP